MNKRKDRLELYKKNNRKRSLKITMSSSVLAGMVAISAFTEAVQAEEVDLNKEEIQDLYNQYNELQTTVNDDEISENKSLDETTTVEDTTTTENEELEFIKTQLTSMIRLAGGESLLEQLDVENLSSNDLNTVFEALLTYQMEQKEDAEAIESESLQNETLDQTPDEVSVNIDEENVIEKQEENLNLTQDNNDTTHTDEITEATQLEENQVEEKETADTSEAANQTELESDQDKLDEQSNQELDSDKPSLEDDQKLQADQAPEVVNESTEGTESETEEKEVVPVENTESETKPVVKPETKPEPKPVTKTKTETKTKTPAKTETKTETKAVIHTVRSGDTLNKIAKQYNTTVANIVSLNKLSNPNYIKVGQKLAINKAAGSSVPTVGTGNLNQTKTTNEFINQISSYAQKVAKENGIYASIMIAQASLESGYGKSQLASPPNHNLFGIKGNYNGNSVAMKTKEYYKSTGWITITDYFKKYPSYAESLQDNARLIRNGTSWNNGYYSGAWIENANSYKDASAWLQGRYATDPTYASKLNRIIEQYGLTRFDSNGNGGSGVGSTDPATPTKPVTSPSTGNNNNGSNSGNVYVIVRGDTLTSIARRNGTTVSAIKSANNLKSDLIFVNQKLTIPGKNSTSPSKEETNKNPENNQNSSNTTYTIKSGDTLTSIARRFNTTVSAIKKANNLKSDLIFVNQKLSVKSQSTGGSSNSGSGNQTDDSSQGSVTNSSYSVVSGDTLTSIARRFKTSITAIKSANNLKSDLIFVGQKLLVSGKTNEPTNSNKDQSQTSSTSYTVSSGDTLSSIARKYKTTVSAIKASNNLKSDLILINQKLTINSKVSTGSNSNSGTTNQNQSTTTSAYTVVSGDTLSGIARRYNTTVAKIKSSNNLKSDLIFVNQKLVINGKTSTKSETVEQNKTDSNEAPVGSYKVVAGDTLSALARRFNTTVAKITRDNKLSSDMIYVGQTLLLAGQKETNNTKEVNTKEEINSINVVSGDTLSGIARKYNTTVAKLKAANNLSSDLIYVGQKLSVTSTSSTKTTTTVKDQAKQSNSNLGLSNYVVSSGDSLYKIALDNNTTVAKLKEWNELSNDTIYIGQKLVIKEGSNTTSSDKPSSSGTYQVKNGDTLSGIALKLNTTVQSLKEKNNLSTDLIFIEQTLTV